VILGERVAVCLLLSAHRAVVFAIAQLSCLNKSTKDGRTDGRSDGARCASFTCLLQHINVSLAHGPVLRSKGQMSRLRGQLVRH